MNDHTDSASFLHGAQKQFNACLPGTVVKRLDPTTDVSIASDKSDFGSVTRFSADGPISLEMSPGEDMLFIRLNSMGARVTNRGYILDSERPIALVDGILQLSSTTRLVGEVVAYPADMVINATRSTRGQLIGTSAIAPAPLAARAEQHWHRTFSYCRDVILQPDPQVPASMETLMGLLLQATVSAFVRPDAGSTPKKARPSVEAAIAFIEAHAAHEIALPAIAEAAGVSERVLYYSFAQDIGSTPAQYLRSVRLIAARQELQSTSASEVSIPDVVAKWHFTSTASFTNYYTRLFSEIPNHTARLDEQRDAPDTQGIQPRSWLANL